MSDLAALMAETRAAAHEAVTSLRRMVGAERADYARGLAFSIVNGTPRPSERRLRRLVVMLGDAEARLAECDAAIAETLAGLQDLRALQLHIVGRAIETRIDLRASAHHP